MGALWRHQSGDAVDQLQRFEVQLVQPGASFVTGGLAVLFGAAVHQLATRFAQPLQRSAIVCFDAHASIQREASKSCQLLAHLKPCQPA